MSNIIIAQLLSYQATTQDPLQVHKTREIIDFINNAQNPLLRSQLDGHITASGLVLDYDGKHAVLLLHNKLGIWIQPGGHADGDPNLLQVASKEIAEETSLTAITPISEDIFDVDVHLIPQHKDVPEHKHYDIRFAFKTNDPKAILAKNHESKDLAWVELNDLNNPVYALDPSVKRLLDKAKNIA